MFEDLMSNIDCLEWWERFLIIYIPYYFIILILDIVRKTTLRRSYSSSGAGYYDKNGTYQFSGPDTYHSFKPGFLNFEDFLASLSMPLIWALFPAIPSMFSMGIFVFVIIGTIIGLPIVIIILVNEIKSERKIWPKEKRKKEKVHPVFWIIVGALLLYALACILNYLYYILFT